MTPCFKAYCGYRGTRTTTDCLLDSQKKKKNHTHEPKTKSAPVLVPEYHNSTLVPEILSKNENCHFRVCFCQDTPKKHPTHLSCHEKMRTKRSRPTLPRPSAGRTESGKSPWSETAPPCRTSPGSCSCSCCSARAQHRRAGDLRRLKTNRHNNSRNGAFKLAHSRLQQAGASA